MNQLLAVLLFFLCAFDAWSSQSRMKRFGIQWEINDSIKWLSKKIGPELGAIIGVMTPATALIAVGLKFHLQWVLALLVGFRLRQFFNQVESHIFQKQIEDFRRKLNADAISGSHCHPSTVAPSSDVEHKMSRTPFQVEDKDGPNSKSR